MSSFILRDEGYGTFKKIVSDRRWVGRVCRHADGSYLGIIGKTTVKAASEREAFDEVVAQHLGYPNAAALRSRNAVVSQANRARKAHSRAVANEMLAGNFEPFMNLMDRVLKAEKE